MPAKGGINMAESFELELTENATVVRLDGKEITGVSGIKIELENMRDIPVLTLTVGITGKIKTGI